MRRTSLGSDGAGTGNGALGAGGLCTSAAASPFLPGATSVDAETGALRGGLFDPEAIRRLGVPQVVGPGSGGAAYDGDGLSLCGGLPPHGHGTAGAAAADDDIDDRFLVPGAVPALNSNGEPLAFVDDDGTPAGTALHQRDEGRLAVVAELRRRGLPTDGATELELLERLEAALDAEAAHTASVAERLRLQSEQRKRTAAAASSGAAAAGSSDGSHGFSAESGTGVHAAGGVAIVAGPGALTVTATTQLPPPPPEDPAVTERRRHERTRMAAEDDRSRRMESWAGALVEMGHDAGDYSSALARLEATMAPEEVALLSLAVDRAAAQRGALQAATPNAGGAAAADAVTAAVAEARRANAAKFAALRAQAAVDAIVLPGEAAGYALDLDSPGGRAQAAGVLRRLCSHLAELRSRRVTAEGHFRRAAVKLRRQQMELVRHRVQAAVVARGLTAATRDHDAIRDALTRAGVPPEAAAANHQLRVAAAEVAELSGRLAHEQALVASLGDGLGALMVTAAGYAAALAYVVRRCGEKETALREARGQLAAAITSLRAAARTSKDAQEAHAYKLLALTAHVADARRRLDALRAERARLRHVTAQYVDTAVLAAAGAGAGAPSPDTSGGLQRVDTDGLRTWLGDEILRHKLETADAEAQLDELQHTMAALQGAYTAAHEDVVTLSRSLRAAVEALKASASGSGLAVEAMLGRLFDVQSVVAHVGRRGGATGAAADSGGKSAARVVDLTDVFGPAPEGGAQLCDEEADALDEDIAAGGDGAVGGASSGAVARGAAVISRRDAAVAWRAQQLNRGVEIDAYVAQMLDDVGDDERAMGALGLALEPAPASWMQADGGAWYTSAARGLALTERPATVLLGPTAATASAAAAAAAASTAAATGDTRALVTLPQPSVKGAAGALAVAAALAGTGASAPDPAFDLTGYASPAAVEGGMHAVLGVPAETATSAFPFAHAPQPLSLPMALLPPSSPATTASAPFRLPRLTAGLSLGGGVAGDNNAAAAASGSSLFGPIAAASTESGSAAAPSWATAAEPSTGADTISLPLTFPLRPPPGTRGRLWSAGSIGSALSSRRGSRQGRTGASRGGGWWAAGLVGSLSMGSVGASGLQVAAGCKLGALVRWLPASDRTAEQKQWVALDRRLWPQRYTRLSAEDERLYALDPAYKCTVPRGTLLRLLALPASPAQALPYLRSPDEVRLHSLLARYSHGMGEEVERLRDQEAGARAVAMAAVARGYVARVKPPLARSAEEADWAALDVLVRPHLYTTSAAARVLPLQRRQTPPPPATGGGDVLPASRGVFSGFTAPGGAPAVPSLTSWRDSQRRVSVSSDAADDDSATLTEAHSQRQTGGAGDDLSLQRNRAAVGGFGGYVRRTLARLLDYDGRRSKARSDSYDGLRRDAATAAAAKAAAQAARRAPTARRSRNSRSASGAMASRDGSGRLVTAFTGTAASSVVLAAALAASQPSAAASQPQLPPPPPTGLEQIAAFERAGGYVTRPEPGVLADGYTRDDLLALMATRPADLTSDRDRRAQLLLRAYGSDGGEALYRAALRRVTPVVAGLGEVADALDATSKERAASGDVDYASELGRAYPDGDATNVAAVAVQAVTAGVLVRARHSREVLCVTDAPLRPGLTADHAFELPGSLADVVAVPDGRLQKKQRPPSAPAQQQRPSSAQQQQRPGSASSQRQQRPMSAPRPGSARPPPAAGSPPQLRRSTTNTNPISAAADDGATPPALVTAAERETGCPGASPVAVDLTVTVVFHGAFLDKAYALGKLTACLYREPVAPDGQPPQPQPLSSSAMAAVLVPAADSARPSSASRRGGIATTPAAVASASFTGPEGLPAVKPSAAVRQALLRPLDVDPTYLAQQVARHGDTAPMVLTEGGALLGWARDEDEAAYLDAEAAAAAADQPATAIAGGIGGGYASDDPEMYLSHGGAGSSSSSRGRTALACHFSVTRAGTAATGWQPYGQLPTLPPAQATAARNRRFKRRGRIMAAGALAGLEATMALKRPAGWYMDDARRQLQEMGASIAALPPPPASRRRSSSRGGSGGTTTATGRRRASSANPPLRLLTAAPAFAAASRGATRSGTAAAFSSSLPLALRPLTGSSRLSSRGGLATAAGGGRPGTVAPIVPWRSVAEASSSGTTTALAATRRGRRGSTSADEATVLPALPLPLSWRLPTHLLPNLPQDQLVASTRVPLGYAVASECRPNSVDALGRLVIRHEPLTVPLLPGRYCVSVTGFSPGSYSVSVTCGLAYGAPTAIDGAVLTAATVDGDIADAREDLTDMLTAERLGARKRVLVDGLIADSEAGIAALGQQVATLHAALASRSIVRADLGSDDEDGGGDGDGGGSLADALAAATAAAAADDDDNHDGGGSGGGRSATAAAAGDQAADAGAILAARRKKQRVSVDAAVETRIQARLRKLDVRLLGAVRTRETRTREAGDVSDGIAQLSEARQTREAELDALLAKARETARHLPAIVDAIGLADPASRAAPRPLPLSPQAQAPSVPAGDSAGGGSGLVSLHAQLRTGTADGSSGVNGTVDGGRPPATAATYARVPADRAALPPAPYDVPTLPPAVIEYARYGGRLLRWRAASAAERALELAPTPAGLVRRKPLADLTPDEREWAGYDRVLAPHHYDRRTDAQDPDAELDRLLADAAGGGSGGGAGGGLAGSDAAAGSAAAADGASSRLDALVPKAQYTRPELLRIISVPLGQLAATERRIRALLGRYHDNRVVAAAASGEGGGSAVGSGAGSASPALTSTQAPPGGSNSGGSPTAPASDGGGSPQLEALVRRARHFTAEPHFHPGASPFAMARSAVPIPQRAPAGLRALLRQRGERLGAVWAALRRDPRATAVEAVAAAAAAAAAARAAAGGGVGEDVDQRARDLLAELDRAYACSRPTMDSALLHGGGREQRFAVPELRSALELELDRVLIGTVTEREALEAAIIQQRVDVNLAAARAAAADEAARLQARRQEALHRMMLREAQRVAAWEADHAASSGGAGRRVLLTPYELAERQRKDQAAAELAAALAQTKAGGVSGGGTGASSRRGSTAGADSAVVAVAVTSAATTTTARPELFTSGEYAYDSRDPVLELGGLAHWGDAAKPPTPSRLAQARAAAEAARLREREALRAARDAGASPDVRARMVAVWKKRRAKGLASSSAGVAAATLASLGPGGCLACMAAPCRWAPSVPVEAVRDRLREVEAELLRVRCMGGSGPATTVLSTVALSFHRGGPCAFTKADLVFELAYEAAGLHDKLRLAELDGELHALCAATGDTVTTAVLHGHPQTTGREAAISSLRAQLAPLTARQVAEGVVDDILDWMEEGWHFGERPSELPAAGYVPSLGLTARGIGASAAAVAAHAAATRAGKLGPAAAAAAAHAARGLHPLFAAAAGPDGGSGDARTTALAALLPARFVVVGAQGQQQYQRQQRQRRSSVAAGGSPAPASATTTSAVTLRASATAAGNTPHAVELRAALSGELSAQRRLDALLASDAPLVRSGSGQLQLVLHGSAAGGGGGSGGGQHQLLLQSSASQPAVPPPFPLERTHADTHAGAISSVAAAREVFLSALQTQAEVAASLDGGEATLKVGMFLMSLHYFKLMTDLAQLREMVAGRAVVVAAGGDGGAGGSSAVTHKRGPDPAATPALSAQPTAAAADRGTQEACADERSRMNDTERARLKRQAALTLANAKALAGWAARAQRLADASASARRLSTLKARKRTAEAAAAVDIQRTWRGYRARCRFDEYVRSLRYGETLAERRALAAVRLQAAWRGNVARQYAADVRAELHAFIRHVRAEERDELMDAYYEANAVRAGVDGMVGYFARRKHARAVAGVAKQRLLDDADIRARLGPAVLATAARNAVRAERRGSLDASSASLSHAPQAVEADANSGGLLPALLARPGGRVVTFGDRLALRDAVDDANVAHAGRDAGLIDLDALGDDDAYFGIRRPPPPPKRTDPHAQGAPASASRQGPVSHLPALPAPASRSALEDDTAGAGSGRGSRRSPLATTTARRELPRLTAGHNHSSK
jgi:hypothetical protein